MAWSSGAFTIQRIAYFGLSSVDLLPECIVLVSWIYEVARMTFLTKRHPRRPNLFLHLLQRAQVTSARGDSEVTGLSVRLDVEP
jgi:hypothetical protein